MSQQFLSIQALRNAPNLVKGISLLKLSTQVIDQFVMDNGSMQNLVNSILTRQEQEEMTNSQSLTADGRFHCKSQECDKTFAFDSKRRRDHEMTHDPPPFVPEPTVFVSTKTPKTSSTSDTKDDDVFNYNCSLLNQGLLFMNFIDATSEGDGERTLRCWKLPLLHFKANKSTTKYALETPYLLFQVKSLLPPDQAHKLVWNRTVNNKGGLVKNVALDLDLEHDNNYLKQSIKTLGANVTPQAVTRISRAQKVTKQILTNLDKDCFVKSKSGKHV